MNLAPGQLFNDVRHAQGARARRDDVPVGDLKRALTKIQRALRDSDASSSIIGRFDEATKLLFLKLRAELDPAHASPFDWQARDTVSGYARRLRAAFTATANGRPSLFPENFRSLKLSDAALASAGRILAAARLCTSAQDVAGLAYEEMIRNTFDKGANQQFFTPQPIVEFLISLMEPHLKDAVCDPACGTGGLLVEVAKRASGVKTIAGLEIDERLAWVSGINLFVRGAPNFAARCIPAGGTLGRHGRRFAERFDAIVTNPPFGSDFSERAELKTYVLGKGRCARRRGILFIERCLDLLKDGGWLGIVIDEGVLSLAHAEDVRELILARAEVHAVISLPETAFMPYASVNTSILVLRKAAPAPAGQMTFFARADHVGRKASGEADLLYADAGVAKLRSDLPRILAAWRLWRQSGELAPDSDSAFLADLRAPAGGLERTGNRLDLQFHHPMRRAAATALRRSRFPLTALESLCSVRKEGVVPATDLPDCMIPYTGLVHIEAATGRVQQALTAANSLRSAVRRYYRGDILFARMRPNLRKAALIDFDEPGYASAECAVLLVREDASGVPRIDPFLLATLLRSDFVLGQLMHRVAGIGRPRISLKDLLAVEIPLPPLEKQLRIRELFNESRAHSSALRRQAGLLAAEACAAECAAVNDLGRQFLGNG